MRRTSKRSGLYNRRVGGFRKVLLTIGAMLGILSLAKAWQMPWREYPGQDNIAVPPDYQEKTEWAFARLMYPPYPGFGGGFGALEAATGEMADPVGPPIIRPRTGMSRSLCGG